MTPSALIVQAWTNAHGSAIQLWADFIPEEAQSTFPIAAFVHAGFTDDEGPLSGTPLESEQFAVMVYALDRRLSRALARRFKTAVEDLEDTDLSDSEAKLSELTVKWSEGSTVYWETRVAVSLTMWNQAEE
jgi:hypothetical protein